MLNALPHRKRLREGAVSQRGLVVREVRLAPNLSGVRLAPGVLAVGMRREVERLAGGLDGFRRIGPRQTDPRERNEQLDPQQAIAARDGMEQTCLGIAQRSLRDRRGRAGGAMSEGAPR